MKDFQQFIGGALKPSASSGRIAVENPYTNATLGSVPDGNGQDAQEALDCALRAQGQWAARTATDRASYLKKFAAGIRAKRVELARLLASEQAKVLPLAQVEVDFTAEYFDYYAGWSRIYEGEIIQSDRPNETMLLFRKPYGVVVGICPWNFPLFVAARKIAPALLTGNTIVLKPSSTVPMTVMAFAEIAAQTDLPAGVLNIISGAGGTLGETLTSSPHARLISLTGSVEAGQRVIRAAAENITKVSLELGGKAPAIVCADADLDLAVKSIVMSRVIFSGQVCNCCERVYVDKKIEAQFTEKLIAAMRQVTLGDPFAEPAPDMSSQVSKAQQTKIVEMVERAKKDGAALLTGGTIPETPSGYFFSPTVLGNCRQDMDIVQNEVFGPVLPVLPFTEFEEAISLANDSDYGLTSSLYSNNIKTIMHGLKLLQFGETYVNRENFEAMQGFHAGWRRSGVGGADGKHGLMEYLQTHLAYIQS